MSKTQEIVKYVTLTTKTDYSSMDRASSKLNFILDSSQSSFNEVFGFLSHDEPFLD